MELAQSAYILKINKGLRIEVVKRISYAVKVAKLFLL